ncbi:MAG: hypothetical protein GEU87_11515 [Alphaproteobacteria bacterium]|nr:hypothetical protein [Alphaproteobacteria bacterium]
MRNTKNVPRRCRPRCGASTRRGIPCQAPAVWDIAKGKPRNGRCRLHGGLSTGPKTVEGWRRSLEALRSGRAAWVAWAKQRRWEKNAGG